MSGLRWAKVDFHVFLRTFLSSFVGSFVVVGLNGLNEPCHSLLRAKTPSRCLSGQTSASRDVFLNLRIFCKLFFKLYQLAEEFGFWYRCGMEEFAMKKFSLVWTCCEHLLCTVHAVFLPWHWPGATLFVWRRGVITCHKLCIHLRPNTISNRDDTLLQAISRRQTANQLDS